MKNLKKIVLITGSLMILLTGCSQGNNSKSSKETVSESAVVSGSEIDEMINSNKKAFVAIGDFDSKNYELLRDNLTIVCAEKKEDMYVLNTKDDNNSEWLSENNVIAETNVAILYNGKLYVLDLKYEEEYQSELLGSMLDGIISQVSGTN